MLLGAARERFWYLSPLRLAASLPGRGGGVRPGAALARERRDGRRRLQGDVRLGEGRSRRARFLGWRGALGVRAEKLGDGKEKRVRESTRQNTAKGQGRRRESSWRLLIRSCISVSPHTGGLFPSPMRSGARQDWGQLERPSPSSGLSDPRRHRHRLGAAGAALGSPQVPP